MFICFLRRFILLMDKVMMDTFKRQIGAKYFHFDIFYLFCCGLFFWDCNFVILILYHT